jgi:hypothetical protein
MTSLPFLICGTSTSTQRTSPGANNCTARIF